jgi:hypothetical protein
MKGEDIKEVVITQTGADGKDEIKDDPLFKSGEGYLLFLHEYEPGKYFVTGGPQGRYKIIGGKVYSMNHLLPSETYFPPEGLNMDGVLINDFVESISMK